MIDRDIIRQSTITQLSRLDYDLPQSLLTVETMDNSILTVPLGSLNLDAYKLPSGEKRIGSESAAIALGVALEALPNTSDGSISISDFVALAIHEAKANANVRAIVLLAAFAEVGLESMGVPQ